MVRLLSLAQKLAMLPQAAQPQKVLSKSGLHHVWHKPQFSKRQVFLAQG